MKWIDIGSLIVIGVTLVLFVTALFAKGMTHDILLEAGVLLVSVKLIMMAWKNSQSARETHRLLEELRRAVGDLVGSGRLSDRPR